MAQKIMAWSKCKIEIGLIPAEGDPTLTDIGTILNNSSSLSSEVGNTMQMIATGGEVVAEEEQEGTVQLVTTVIEPTSSLMTLLGIASSDDIKTHVVDGAWKVKLTPKNVGARGISAPNCSIVYQPAWSEENGNQAILTFKFHKTDAGVWYSYFTKTASAQSSGGGSAGNGG